MPGVTVRATNPATGLSQSTVTSTAGDWTIASLPVGRYELSFELDGFKKLTRSDVLVEAVVTRQVPVTLEVGSVAEVVNVSADAPMVVANTAATYRRLNADELTLVPTSTRSFTHLLSAEAGVSADLPPVLINGTGNISPSVNGTRTTSTSLFFNGIDATNITSNEGSMTDNISPAPEMLEEVKLQTSLYDASTGRSGGGNFQLITRSGTNNLRGAGFFSVQHERLQRQRLLLQQGRHRQAESPPVRGWVHGRRSAQAEQAVLLRRLPADGRRNGFRADREQPYRASGRAAVDRWRPHEGEPVRRVHAR